MPDGSPAKAGKANTAEKAKKAGKEGELSKGMNLSELTHGVSTIGDYRLFMPNSSHELTLGVFFGITS